MKITFIGALLIGLGLLLILALLRAEPDQALPSPRPSNGPEN
jgi:hypothetical protein